MRISSVNDFTYGQPLKAFFYLDADVGTFCRVCLYESNIYTKPFARRYCTTMIARDICYAQTVDLENPWIVCAKCESTVCAG